MRRMLRGVLAVGLLIVGLASRAYADPVTIAGVFVVDAERPGAITFDLSSIASGVPFRVVEGAPGDFTLAPLPAGFTLGCDPHCLPGSTFDFSNATLGLQPFGHGTVIIGDILHSDLIFTGAFTFRSPGAVIPGPPTDPDNPAQHFPVISAPFSFSGTLIAERADGAQLLSTDLVGAGRATTRLRWTGIDFMLDEVTTIAYLFDAAQPTPEPGSLLLIATGVAAAVTSRRRTVAAARILQRLFATTR
jgi:PEP-CTERM motif